MEVLTCPSLFAEMITKFEASFILREHTLNNILGAAYFPALTEIKLIQCGAANDTLLQKIAQVSVLSVVVILHDNSRTAPSWNVFPFSPATNAPTQAFNTSSNVSMNADLIL